MNTYYCFDCETQGIKEPYPVQISIIIKKVGNHEYLGEFMEYVKPIGQLSPAAIVVHGITNVKAANFPVGERILVKLSKFLREEVQPRTVYAVGHNIRFDIDTLNNFVSLHTNEEAGFETEVSIDTLRLAQKLIPKEEIGGYNLDACWYFLNKEENSLEILSATRVLHDAKMDVIMTMDVFEWLIELLPPDKRNLADIAKFCTQPEMLERMPFGKHEGMLIQDVPKSYIEWFIRQGWAEQWPDLLHTIEEQLGLKR